MHGVSVMLGVLSGNEETVSSLSSALNKTISELRMESDELIIRFSDGSGIKIWDDGQSCCENRYMMTSDNLLSFVGSAILGLELLDAPDVSEEYIEHEVQFLHIKTTVGVFVMETHNEHNGYYGGFLVRCAAL